MNEDKYHKPVLIKEVLGYLAPLENLNGVVDATLGTAGYTIEILKLGRKVLGIDMDPYMVSCSEKRILEDPVASKTRFRLVQGNFKELDVIVRNSGFYPADAVIFDLGVANLHFFEERRGFSFNRDEELLDMRLDPASYQIKASDLINGLREDQLIELFNTTLNYRETKRLVGALIKARGGVEIKTVGDFMRAVKKALPKESSIHPATRPFLALRIAVNRELDNLSEALPKAFSVLRRKGRMMVVTFHSKEVDVVKLYLKSVLARSEGVVLAEEAILPREEEVVDNPRARSAKLWLLEKT